MACAADGTNGLLTIVNRWTALPPRGTIPLARCAIPVEFTQLRILPSAALPLVQEPRYLTFCCPFFPSASEKMNNKNAKYHAAVHPELDEGQAKDVR